ncbi:MAG: virulence protein RhuM/Fic/DOC family protein [Candidatus Paceibacterota bacterium]|jgi:prophage maintenance system killer protein
MKKQTMKKENEVIIYQATSGAIEFRTDAKKETLWATQAQMARVFGVNPQAVIKHLKNIYKDGELSKSATCSKMEQVQKEGARTVNRFVDIYNLDAVISVGYRINSKTGTKFRQWATKTLHSHIVDGYTINRSRIVKNYDEFLKAVEQVKKLLPAGGVVDAEGTLELVKLFASTWFSLDAYDHSEFPKTGATKKQVKITANDLEKALAEFKHNLLEKGETTELFGTERQKDSVAGIVGNVFQSFGGKDLYGSAEEKATHLLYFIVKNHPFTDGNKRSGAFSFVWFLKRTRILDTSRMTPEALTVLTLLVAESDPKDKDRMVGLILMLLKK